MSPCPFIPLLASLLALPLATARAAPPRIDSTFPPTEDRRGPDIALEAPEGGKVVALAFSSDGRTLITASADHRLRLWNARPGKGAGTLLHTLGRMAQLPLALGFAADNKTVLALTPDRQLRRWPVPSPPPAAAAAAAAAVTTSTEALPAMARTPRLAPALLTSLGGKDVLLGVTPAGAAQAVAIPGGEVTELPALPARPAALAISGEGKLLAFVARGNGRRARSAEPAIIHLLDLATPGSAPRSLSVPGPVTALALSKKGESLATADDRGEIRVWDVPSGALLAIQAGHRGPVPLVAFNPNGQKMTSAGRDGSLRTWTVPLPPLPSEDRVAIEAAVPAAATARPARPRRLLVFWRAEAILHKAGVPAANHALLMMGKRTGAFEVHFSRDYEVFDAAVLKGYDALVLNSTAHLAIPDDAKKQALLDWVRGGGAVVGIHAAIDMFKDWPEGAAVVGATFASHPWGPSGTWQVKLERRDHPLLRAWDGSAGFKMKDEFYELGAPYGRGDREVLLSLDMSDPATAGVKPLHRQDRDFAAAWSKSFGKGRVFYCMFGHVAGPFHDPRVQRFYLDGIQWALGDLVVEGARAAR